MILSVYTLTLEPEHPPRFSASEFREFLNRNLAAYTTLHRTGTAGFIHRYPVIQCKLIKGNLVVVGISQGAGCLHHLTQNQKTLGLGENSCLITSGSADVRDEPFGVADTTIAYEFLTPWVALNQQNANKFYDLDGKPARDTFMQKLLTAQLQRFAKSLEYDMTTRPFCEAKVRFRRERIGRENVIVFFGKFRTNLRIPDYLGIGNLVSQGYGTIKRITESPDSISGKP